MFTKEKEVISFLNNSERRVSLQSCRTEVCKLPHSYTFSSILKPLYCSPKPATRICIHIKVPLPLQLGQYSLSFIIAVHFGEVLTHCRMISVSLPTKKFDQFFYVLTGLLSIPYVKYLVWLFIHF